MWGWKDDNESWKYDKTKNKIEKNTKNNVISLVKTLFAWLKLYIIINYIVIKYKNYIFIYVYNIYNFLLITNIFLYHDKNK